MGRWLKVSAVKPDDLNLIPKLHRPSKVTPRSSWFSCPQPPNK
ncbi:rCG58933 [Rattus norvegicus]|uniref:RCG58933 n=1 Tax=Rattus norvegicus TaxID=10116 RepID=A6KQ78_RAT|nr:rCG58933 [Rattus norvegicus]